MWRRESGLVRIDLTTFAIWSIGPSGDGQERHWLP